MELSENLFFSFFHSCLCVSATRYFSSRSANCCIPAKRARSRRTRAKTDTRISSPVSGAASCCFLCLSLPVETATQIDARPSSAMGREDGVKEERRGGLRCVGVGVVTLAAHCLLPLSCTFNGKLFFLFLFVFFFSAWLWCRQSTRLGWKSWRPIQTRPVQTTSTPTTSGLVFNPLLFVGALVGKKTKKI